MQTEKKKEPTLVDLMKISIDNQKQIVELLQQLLAKKEREVEAESSAPDSPQEVKDELLLYRRQYPRKSFL